MKTHVIYYSKTGNTHGVAIRIAAVMHAALSPVKALSDDPNDLYPILTESPTIEQHDHLIFGSPVHGFSLCKIMNTYLNQLADLSDKKIDLFITHFFPFAWMGGNRTLRQMKGIIESKGGKIRFMTSINWKSKKREVDIMKMIARYSHEEAL
jgi:NAD(P)H dehydrogenase (quinone)